MKPTIKSYGIVDAEKPQKNCLVLKEKGFSYLSLDLEMFLSQDYLEWKDSKYDKEGKPFLSKEKFDDFCNRLVEAVGNSGLIPNIVLAPYLMPETKREDRNELLKELAEAAIKVAGAAGAPYVVVQPLFAGVEKALQEKINADFYLGLAETARENKVQILIENQVYFHENRYVRGFLSDSSALIQWVEDLNEKVGFSCFEIGYHCGNANLIGINPGTFLREAGRHLKMVRLTENDGAHNAEMLPFSYGWNRNKSYGIAWNDLIGALRAIDFDDILLLDMTTTLANVPYTLRDSLLMLASQTLSYMEWVIEIERKIKSYEHIVLFGAGNMCKQYMRCYGKDYPPLFTCDNNPDLWGTEAYGLEVKSPQELLEIPENTGIFICNMYYREIEKQLQDMGVQNIEFFNDEFLTITYPEEE